jgi:hypothetical protein
MARIQVPFIGLEIVALVKNFSNQPVSRRRIERFVGRQKRRFSGTHIGKDESANFLARIGRMLDLVSKVLARSLTGLFQTVSMNVIEPTVIKATEPTIFDSAVAQIGPAMRTVESQ